MRYTRIADGANVPKTEACDARGMTRAGYSAVWEEGDYIGFDMAFLDGAPSRDMRAAAAAFADTATTLTDAERTFADSAEGRAFVARQQMTHDLSQAWRPSAERSELSSAAITFIVRGEVGRRSQAKAQHSQYATDAETAKAAALTARAMMIENMQTAWKA